jgi:rhomboid protease GluP
VLSVVRIARRRQRRSCYTCGRANPGLWGFGPLLRQLGADLGFVPLVMGASSAIYLVMLIASGTGIRMDGMMSIMAPSTSVLFLFGASGAVPVFGFGRWWTVLSAGGCTADCCTSSSTCSG